MSANELRQAAETLRANPYAVLRGNAPLVIAQALDRAAHQFEDAEHIASTSAILAMVGVDPAYPPLARDLLTVARSVNG